MKFVFGGVSDIGIIGFEWSNIFGAIGSVVLCIIILLLAIIGLVTVIKMLLFGRKKSKSKYKYFKD